MISKKMKRKLQLSLSMENFSKSLFVRRNQTNHSNHWYHLKTGWSILRHN